MQPLDLTARAAYLDRIEATPPRVLDGDSLAALQLAHLRAVPFENVDIHLGRAISIDADAVYRKVVVRRRGGYCYELNSLFARLLVTLGGRVDLLSARVHRGEGRFGSEYDHLALAVITADGDGPFLVDVGFGDAFVAPLPIEEGVERVDGSKQVRLTRHGDDWWYEEDRGDGWAPQYAFGERPCRLAEFSAMNRYQQSSPDSHFTRQLVCSRLTRTGRTTVTGNRLITTDSTTGARVERTLDDAGVRNTLLHEFGIDVPTAPALADIEPAILANPTAVLATNGSGHPQMTAVWYVIDDGELCVSATAETQKARNLARDVRCSVLVFHPDTPNWYVTIRGTATVTDDADYAFADRVGAKYATDMRSFDGPGARRVKIAVRPVTITETDAR